MLGDIGAAEDVVQDAFTRLMRAAPGEIADERGWLIVVTSRPCLDQIRSARSRRERASDPGQIEAVAPAARGTLADPAGRVTFDDSVHLALLVMLQRLTPAERVVFVLHDAFGMPFDTVAKTVGKTSQACRQLATSARQEISGGGGVRFDVTAAEHRAVTDKFMAAAAKGDLGGLIEVLASGASGDIDYGPAAARPHVVVKAPTESPGTCCTTGARPPRWSPIRWRASPCCLGSTTASWPACWYSPCKAKRSRRST
jgi:RNA polymerase sigma-70 factor, ECF subfamily